MTILLIIKFIVNLMIKLNNTQSLNNRVIKNYYFLSNKNEMLEDESVRLVKDIELTLLGFDNELG